MKLNYSNYTISYLKKRIQVPDLSRSKFQTADIGWGGEDWIFTPATAIGPAGFFEIADSRYPKNASPNPNRQSLYEYLLRFSVVCTIIALIFGLCRGVADADCIAPTALWKLDVTEPSLGFENSQSPGSNTGSCRQYDGVPVCPQAEEGRYGMGQRFYANGNRSGINIPASPMFDWRGKANFSIAFWMKRDNAPINNNEVIIGRINKEADNDTHWWIGVGLNGNAYAFFQDKNDLPIYWTMSLCGDKLVTDNNWHFIVFVRDGASSESRLYVDGVLEDKKKFTHDSLDAFAAPSDDINIGWLNLDPEYNYLGAIDEIALFNVALPQWFIRDRYHADQRYPAGQGADPCE